MVGWLLWKMQESAGVMHLKNLADAGLTHVHLLPCFDFATVNEKKETWKTVGEEIFSFIFLILNAKIVHYFVILNTRLIYFSIILSSNFFSSSQSNSRTSTHCHLKVEKQRLFFFCLCMCIYLCACVRFFFLTRYSKVGLLCTQFRGATSGSCGNSR
jgi:hypothetical protein